MPARSQRPNITSDRPLAKGVWTILLARVSPGPAFGEAGNILFQKGVSTRREGKSVSPSARSARYFQRDFLTGYLKTVLFQICSAGQSLIYDRKVAAVRSVGDNSCPIRGSLNREKRLILRSVPSFSSHRKAAGLVSVFSLARPATAKKFQILSRIL